MHGQKKQKTGARKVIAVFRGMYSALMCLIFTALGGALAAAAVWLSLNCQDATPILLTPPDSATGQLTAMLDAVRDADYEKAGTYLLGNPDLGVTGAPEDAVGALFWERYQASIDYALVGECYATAEGLSQDVTITYLDLSTVTQNLRARSQTLLEQRVAETEDLTLVYDENYEYREDYVMAILYDAALEALEQDGRQVTVELTVNLKYQNGQWWVLVDPALLDAISGGILF